MKTLSKDRRMVLFAALLALVSLIVLGSSLKDIAFRPTQPLSQSDSETIQVSVGDVIDKIADIPVWKQALFWTLLFLLVILVASLLSPEMRKRLLIGFIRMALFIIVFLYITKTNPEFLRELFSLGLPGADQTSSSLTEDIPPPVFEPPQISGWFSFFITFGIILLIGLVVWRINRWRLRQNELFAMRRPLEEIAEVARASLKELSLGDSSAHDVIIQCYERMSRVVVTKRGLNRDFAMTPSEFAVRLEKAGLPHGPVNRLTRLFESVRYGSRTSDQRDVDEAISCLNFILEYCGEAQ